MFRIYAAFAAFLVFVCCQASLALAHDLYSDDAIQIGWPQNIPSQPCNQILAKSPGVACQQIGQDGSLGVVFVTLHPGYSLGSQEALDAHLKESKEALADIKNVQVMQARTIQHAPLIAIMDMIRTDKGVPDIPRLKAGPVRQTSLLIPVGERLAQVFIYLPLEGDDAIQTYAALTEAMPALIVVHDAPIAPTTPLVQEQPKGALTLMPRALLWGITIALIIIAAIASSVIRQRKKRKAEDDKLSAIARDNPLPIDTSNAADNNDSPQDIHKAENDG